MYCHNVRVAHYIGKIKTYSNETVFYRLEFTERPLASEETMTEPEQANRTMDKW